jgi:hypothetical protein
MIFGGSADRSLAKISVSRYRSILYGRGGLTSSRNHWEDDPGRVLGAVEHRLVGDLNPGAGGDVLARVEVADEAREVAARVVQAQSATMARNRFP